MQRRHVQTRPLRRVRALRLTNAYPASNSAPLSVARLSKSLRLRSSNDRLTALG